MAIKYGVVELLVRVVMEVPDHIIERDKGRHEDGYEDKESLEKDMMHDYAVGCINRDVQVLHGQNEDTDWITLTAEVITCEVDEEFRER